MSVSHVRRTRSAQIDTLALSACASSLLSACASSRRLRRVQRRDDSGDVHDHPPAACELAHLARELARRDGELVGVALMAHAPVTGALSVVGFGALMAMRIKVEEKAMG